MPLREAWERALYGPGGFYTRDASTAHFRTSATASPLYAGAVAELAAACDLDTVYDMAAGGGELAAGLIETSPDLRVIAIDVRPRPEGLPARVDWRRTPPDQDTLPDPDAPPNRDAPPDRDALPGRIAGLVIANEWLDNVPCTVAEVGEGGRLREVLVDPATGHEELGADVAGPDLEWARRWWPRSEPGSRVEIGRARDAAWRDVVRSLDHGLAVAIDYGHVEGARPVYGSLRSYRDGRAVDVAYDGSRDITADVALDAVAAAVDGRLLRQRGTLRSLGISGRRPDLELARSDPTGYVRALSDAGAAAELVASPGLGDFGWVVTAVGVPVPW